MRWRISKAGIVVLGFSAVLVVGVIVGLIVPGRTGETILAISAGLLAVIVLVTLGTGSRTKTIESDGRVRRRR